jgi:hypothetical protein
MVQAAADVSAAMGITMDAAIRSLNKSFGGLTGELGELVPELQTLTKEQLKAGEGVDLIRRKFDGAAEAMAQTASGGLKQLGNAFGDLQETLGEQILTSMDGFIGKLTDFITKANEAAAGANALSLALSGEDAGLDPAERLENQRLAVEQLQRKIEEARESANRGQFSSANLVNLERQLEREAEMLRRLENRRDLYGDLERAAGRGAEAEKEGAAAADAVTQRYLDSRKLVLDTLDTESAALAEIRGQIAQLQATPWASGELEQDRLEALEALRQKEQEILIQQGKLIDAQEILGTARQTTAAIFAEEQRKIKEADEEIEEQTERTAENIQSAYQSYVVPSLEALGEALVKQGEAWKALAGTAVGAIADILRALGQQFAAQAAGQFAAGLLPGGQAALASAAAYAAASAAAYTAAGVVSALADNVKSAATGADFVTNGPELMLVGDNPSGREHVQVSPNETSGGAMGGDVYLDGRKVGEWIQSQASKGQLRIAQRAIV